MTDMDKAHEEALIEAPARDLEKRFRPPSEDDVAALVGDDGPLDPATLGLPTELPEGLATDDDAE